jgi:hypothetical protein
MERGGQGGTEFLQLASRRMHKIGTHFTLGVRVYYAQGC